MNAQSKKYLFSILFLIVVSAFVVQGYLFYDFKKDFDNEIKFIDDSLLALGSKIDSENDARKKEMTDLRKESANAIKSLGGNINALLKENEESKKAIEELSEGLEELENVQIQASKDFSSIIEDVIDSVV
ncbi:MAG: hypothetical protein AABX49_00555, partial [Nanoarchaeota archaeon]